MLDFPESLNPRIVPEQDLVKALSFDIASFLKIDERWFRLVLPKSF